MSTSPTGWRMNVAAIVMDDAGNFLLGARPERSPFLHFPQGGVKEGESLQGAIFRELKEEVGVHHARILAEFPGLRYSYGKKNEKRTRWQGQQQCFFLLRMPGVCPPVSCAASTEFSSTCWLPSSRLSPDRFAPTKRDVAQRALSHFFPNFPVIAPTDQIVTRCTPEGLYRFPALNPSPPAPGSPLFSGGKKEALFHLASLPPLRPEKNRRLLVALLGMEGCGLHKGLRNIAASLDPIATRITASPERYALSPVAAFPLDGELCLLSAGPYLSALHTLRFNPSSSTESLAQPLLDLENSLTSSTSSLLKIALYVSAKKQQARFAKKGKPFSSRKYAEEKAALFSLLSATSTHFPWFLIPADHSWYRDYLLHALISHSLANHAWSVPLPTPLS